MLVQSRGLSGPDAPYLCRVLGVCGREGDAAVLRSALLADAAAVRRAAGEALGELRAADDVDEALVFALADEDRPRSGRGGARSGRRRRAGQAPGPLERRGARSERAGCAGWRRVHALGGIAQKAEGDARAPLTSVRRLADSADSGAGGAGAGGAAARVRRSGTDQARAASAALHRPDEEAVKAAARALSAAGRPARWRGRRLVRGAGRPSLGRAARRGRGAGHARSGGYRRRSMRARAGRGRSAAYWRRSTPPCRARSDERGCHRRCDQ